MAGHARRARPARPAAAAPEPPPVPAPVRPGGHERAADRRDHGPLATERCARCCAGRAARCAATWRRRDWSDEHSRRDRPSRRADQRLAQRRHDRRRARELDAHLAGCDQCRETLAGVLARAAAARRPAPRCAAGATWARASAPASSPARGAAAMVAPPLDAGRQLWRRSATVAAALLAVVVVSQPAARPVRRHRPPTPVRVDPWPAPRRAHRSASPPPAAPRRHRPSALPDHRPEPGWPPGVPRRRPGRQLDWCTDAERRSRSSGSGYGLPVNAALSPDRRLACLPDPRRRQRARGHLRLPDLATARSCRSTRARPTRRSRGSAWSPDGSLLAFTGLSEDGQIAPMSWVFSTPAPGCWRAPADRTRAGRSPQTSTGRATATHGCGSARPPTAAEH